MFNYLKIHPAIIPALKSRMKNCDNFYHYYRFLYHEFENTINPFLMTNMFMTVKFLTGLMHAQPLHIFIIGDKDADGVSGISILKYYFESSGHRISYTTPLDNETYGSSHRMIETILDSSDSVDVVITTDMGIKECYLAQVLSERGIPLIITDHHTPSDELPNTPYIINPHLIGENMNFIPISGAQVSLKMVQALVLWDIQEIQKKTFIIHYEPRNKEFTCLILNHPFITQDIELLPKISIVNLFAVLSKESQNPCFVVFTKEGYRQLNLELSIEDVASHILMIEDLEQEVIRGKCIPVMRYPKNPSYGMLLLFQEWLQYHYKVREILSFSIQTAGLVAICDRMPLNHFESRVLVKMAHNDLVSKNTHPIQGIIPIPESLSQFTLQTVPMQICPLLNAGGRLGKADLVVDFLSHPYNAGKAARLIQLNKERQKKQKIGLEEVEAYLSYLDVSNQRFILYASENIHKGVTGIIANRVSKKFHKTTIIVSIQKDIHRLVGSVRSFFPIHDMLATLSDMFDSFGGHQKACGFTCSLDHLGSLESRFKELPWPTTFLEENTSFSSFQSPELSEAVNITLNDMEDIHFFHSIDLFEPYGEENPPILFRIECVIEEPKIFGKKQQHIKWKLSSIKHAEYIFWNACDKYDIIDLSGVYAHITFHIEKDPYYKQRYSCIVQEIEIQP